MNDVTKELLYDFSAALNLKSGSTIPYMAA
jgi:hypothetical protein